MQQSGQTEITIFHVPPWYLTTDAQQHVFRQFTTGVGQHIDQMLTSSGKISGRFGRTQQTIEKNDDRGQSIGMVLQQTSRTNTRASAVRPMHIKKKKKQHNELTHTHTHKKDSGDSKQMLLPCQHVCIIEHRTNNDGF